MSRCSRTAGLPGAPGARFFASLVFAAGALAVAVRASDAEAQGRPPSGAILAGCYALYYDDGRRVDSTSNHAAPAVRLDTVRYGSGPGAGQYRLTRLTAWGAPVRNPAPEGRIPPTWRILPAVDSLALSFVNGFEGASFMFAVPRLATDTLRGRTENVTDYAPPAQRRGAIAVRIRCLP